jgi:hypothetical protein
MSELRATIQRFFTYAEAKVYSPHSIGGKSASDLMAQVWSMIVRVVHSACPFSAEVYHCIAEKSCVPQGMFVCFR